MRFFDWQTRLSSRQRGSLLCITFCIATGCGDPLGVPRFDLPEPSPSLEPDSVKIGPVRYLCDQWFNGPAPVGPTVILDAYFIGDSALFLDRPPADKYLKAVGEVGGAVGHIFHFAAARIKIAPEQVPELVARTNAVLYGVPDLRRYDWEVLVRYSRDLTPDDISMFASLGGRVTRVVPSIPSLLGYLPNRSIPSLRANSGVMYVRASYHFCNSA